MVLSSATGSSELWVANESNVIMDFFDRKSEIGCLRSERDLSKKVARMTVVTGRRRVGKTQLIQRAMGDEPVAFFQKNPDMKDKKVSFLGLSMRDMTN